MSSLAFGANNGGSKMLKPYRFGIAYIFDVT